MIEKRVQLYRQVLNDDKEVIATEYVRECWVPVDMDPPTGHTFVAVSDDEPALRNVTDAEREALDFAALGQTLVRREDGSVDTLSAFLDGANPDETITFL